MSDAQPSSDRDHLSNDVTVSAKLEERGLSLSTQSRFVAAVDRLLGALADVPAAYCEGIAERVRVRNRKKIQSIDPNDKEGLDRVLVETLTEEKAATSIENRAVVIRARIDHLENGVDDKPLEFEWIDEFGRYAETASSDQMRDVWARILAGKINSKGDFSTSTLKIVSSLDSETAGIFQKYNDNTLGAFYVPVIEQASGKALEEQLHLAASGLIHGNISFLSRHLRAQPQPNGEKFVMEIEGEFALIGKVDGDVQVDSVMFTKAGRELARILPNPDPKAVLKRLFQACQENLISALLVQVLSEEGDILQWRELEVLKKP